MLIKKAWSTTYILMIVVAIFFFFINSLGEGLTQEIDPDMFNQLKYRHIGPQGNRIIAVLGVPGDPNIC